MPRGIAQLLKNHKLKTFHQNWLFWFTMVHGNNAMSMMKESNLKYLHSPIKASIFCLVFNFQLKVQNKT